MALSSVFFLPGPQQPWPPWEQIFQKPSSTSRSGRPLGKLVLHVEHIIHFLQKTPRFTLIYLLQYTATTWLGYFHSHEVNAHCYSMIFLSYKGPARWLRWPDDPQKLPQTNKKLLARVILANNSCYWFVPQLMPMDKTHGNQGADLSDILMWQIVEKQPP